MASACARTSSGHEIAYQRLGGYDVIAGVVDAWQARVGKDPRFARFGGTRSLTSRRRGRQQTVELLCQAAGGPCFYVGPDMKAVHAGLGIGDELWQAQLTAFEDALDSLKVPAKEKQELLDIMAGFKGAVAEKAKAPN